MYAIFFICFHGPFISIDLLTNSSNGYLRFSKSSIPTPLLKISSAKMSPRILSSVGFGASFLQGELKMGVRERTMKKRCILGYMRWCSRKKTWFSNTFDPPKGIKDAGQVHYDDRIESGMVFLGFVSFYDPPKESTKQALWRLAEKGVKANVLTGDSLSIAIRICEEVGIKTTHLITGPDLEFLGHYSFHETVKQATVLARLTPTQKLRVVQSLQKVGDHVVGFLGDGVNDSLALDAANVSISVDSGAPIAKDLADIILIKKYLNVLVAGVEHGRLTFGNTMKYIKMSVIANLGSILSLLIATLSLGIEPLTPRQLLTQNFLYNVVQIAIPWDKIEEDYVKTQEK